MMDDMTDHEAAKRGDSRHRKHFMAGAFERPPRRVFGIRFVHRRAGAPGGFVEDVEDVLA